ncbi:Heat shock protein 70 A2, partial [Orchesella cincta]
MTKDNNLLGSFDLSGIPPAQEVCHKLKSPLILMQRNHEPRRRLRGCSLMPEKYKKEDEMQQERIKAKNQLEAYLFEVLDKCNENLKWLDSNALAEKEEYEDRLKEMEKELPAIMMKMHGAGAGGAAPGGAGFPGGFPGGFPVCGLLWIPRRWISTKRWTYS